MSKPTLILIIILFLLTGGLLTLALNKSFYSIKEENQPPISSTPTNNPNAPDTSLLFGDLDVASSSSYPKTYSLPILIKTGTNKVSAVQIELSFDPGILTNVSMKPSTFFKSPNVVINKINTAAGRIYYALVKTASESAKQREGTLATLTFESQISPFSSVITFLPRTFVTAEGFDGSALKSTNSAKLTINP